MFHCFIDLLGKWTKWIKMQMLTVHYKRHCLAKHLKPPNGWSGGLVLIPLGLPTKKKTKYDKDGYTKDKDKVVSADSAWVNHKKTDKEKDKIRQSQEQKDKDKDKTPEASKWTGGVGANSSGISHDRDLAQRGAGRRIECDDILNKHIQRCLQGIINMTQTFDIIDVVFVIS